MNYKIILKFIILFNFIIADPYEQLDIDFLKNKKASLSTEQTKSTTKKNKKDLPLYLELIESYSKIEGCFTFFWDQNKNKLLISIHPDQFNNIYLANMTRQSGDGYYYDSSSMMNEFPFQFKKIAGNIQFIHINTMFRADEDKAIHKAIKDNLSNSIISKGKILSQPHPENGSILVDANELFLRDLGYISNRKNSRYSFDIKNSYFIDIKSFLKNSEIELSAHYKSNKWTNAYTLPNSRSMEIKYHISLSVIPNNGFIPRIADDRVGYFSTIYQDYSNTLQETQYVRYINRWNLKKKNPDAYLSEPIEPIVFWIENKVPEEFRAAVKEGILAWNEAFEKIGFKNAILAKQMPDDAHWDPADVRYNTIRWIIQPGSGYAVGPSRADPYTGQLYDADVRISADFVRGFYREFDEFVGPLTKEDFLSLWDEEKEDNFHTCKYSDHLRDQMSIGWHHMITNNYIDGSNSDLKDYVHKGLVDLVLHEVGHTLGLRHNFKASSIFSIEQLSDPKFTASNGISGSVMDYHPVNLFDKGKTVFQTKPGPYDIWAIEYGYTEINNYNIKNQLENIAGKSNHPLLVYGTDEDTFGRSSRGVDPLCSLWDLSSNPLGYYENQISMVNDLWENLIYKFKVEGNRYQKIRSVFSQGIGEYRHAGISVPKFIGGINVRRNHIGDPGDQVPFNIISAEKQREALNFMKNYIFNKHNFNFNPELLNMLAPERHEDFQDYAWRLDRIDYPIHSVVERIHNYSLYSLFHPRRLARIQDNERKTKEINPFTLEELFVEMNDVIWEELSNNENINSYRRQLQKNYLNLLSYILYSDFDFTNDAISLSRYSLKNLLKEIYLSMGNQNYDNYTKAHLSNSAEMIETILNAEKQIY